MRSGDEGPFAGRLLLRLDLGLLWRFPAFGRSHALLRMAGGSLPLLLAGTVLVVTVAALGPYTIPASHTVDILLQQVGLGDAAAPETEKAIIASIRLPRIVLPLMAGGVLGVAGAVMQGPFRNRMADPGIIGVAVGGALGAVIAISTDAQAAFVHALPAMSFAGAAGALLLALVPADRIAALAKFASNQAYSNICEQAADLPVFEKGAENVLAANSDLFIVSRFTKQDIVELVKEAGMPVVRPALETSVRTDPADRPGHRLPPHVWLTGPAS